MKNAKIVLGLCGSLGVAALLALACSTDSPTAPEQNPPGPGGGTSVTNFRITIDVDPFEIEVEETACGAEGSPADIVIEVRDATTNHFAPDETTLHLQTSLGSFVAGGTPVRETGVELFGGRAFAQLFGCTVPGVARVRGSIGTSFGTANVRITADPLQARFSTSNPEGNTSVLFNNVSTGLPTSQLWRFGDGTQSNESSPHHVYNQPGNYNVRLTIHRGNRSDTCAKTISTSSVEEFTCGFEAEEPEPEPPPEEGEGEG